MSFRVALLAALLLINGMGVIGLSGCDRRSRPLTAAQRGAVLYRTNCASCHGPNPHQPGALGPAIAGSPRSLIEARVLHRAYPPGYHPKRSSHLMLPLPWMAGHIDDLAAYLNAEDGHDPSVRANKQ